MAADIQQATARAETVGIFDVFNRYVDLHFRLQPGERRGDALLGDVCHERRNSIGTLAGGKGANEHRRHDAALLQHDRRDARRRIERCRSQLDDAAALRIVAAALDVDVKVHAHARNDRLQHAREVVDLRRARRVRATLQHGAALVLRENHARQRHLNEQANRAGRLRVGRELAVGDALARSKNNLATVHITAAQLAVEHSRYQLDARQVLTLQTCFV